MMQSLTLIVPAAQRDAANRLACALGTDTLPGSSYNVPLSATGAAPATHYGCHAWASDGFVATLGAAIGGTVPALDLDAVGLTETDVAGVLAMLTHAVSSDSSPSWDAALEGHGLVRVDE